jgi:cryptochrome
MKFLLESLADLNDQFKKHGGHGLWIFRGDPVEIFRKLWQELGINKICFEQDCEPIWHERDKKVKILCEELEIDVVEKVSHTLWNPIDVIKTNGGFPPLTYQMFLHTVNVIGQPPRTVEIPDFSNVNFGKIPANLNEDLGVFDDVINFKVLNNFHFFNHA